MGKAEGFLPCGHSGIEAFHPLTGTSKTPASGRQRERRMKKPSLFLKNPGLRGETHAISFALL